MDQIFEGNHKLVRYHALDWFHSMYYYLHFTTDWKFTKLIFGLCIDVCCYFNRCDNVCARCEILSADVGIQKYVAFCYKSFKRWKTYSNSSIKIGSRRYCISYQWRESSSRSQNHQLNLNESRQFSFNGISRTSFKIH